MAKLIHNATKRAITITYLKQLPNKSTVSNRVVFTPGINSVEDSDFETIKGMKYFKLHCDAGNLTDSDTAIKQGKEIKAQAESELQQTAKAAEALAAEKAKEAEALATDNAAKDKEIEELKAQLAAKEKAEAEKAEAEKAEAEKAAKKK